MDFFEHYLQFNAGNMAPQKHHLWSAISILGMAINKKCYIRHPQFDIWPQLYICLVAPPGRKKSFAKDVAHDLFFEAFPGFPKGSAIQSREDIVKLMASTACLKKFTGLDGAEVEYHPLAFFINELSNFMSINIGAMVEFLTDMYDRKYFDASTIKHGKQFIVNPFLGILACTTPKWIISKFKEDIIGGGFNRRMLIVYETEKTPRITFPFMTADGVKSRQWCLQHLTTVESLVGEFKWESQETMDKFDQWYKNLPEVDDPVLADLNEARDILVQKISMIHAAAQPEPKLILTWKSLSAGINAMSSLVENLPLLSVATGRNILAVSQNQLLQHLVSKGGFMSEKDFHYQAGRDLQEFEYNNVKNFLRTTEQIVETELPIPNTNPPRSRKMIYTKAKWNELQKNGNGEH